MNMIDKPKTRNTKSKKTNYIREWRIYRGVKQSELDALFSGKPGFVSRLETGKCAYNPRNLGILATFLGCTPAELIGVNPLDPSTLQLVELIPPLQAEGLIAEVAAFARFKLGR
jgi:transcriptional regulator with XRE-family HTH domain